MPRKHRAARERPHYEAEAGPATVGGPEWAAAPGVEVRSVSGDKAYRCPGCDHEIRAGLAHLVVVPEADAAERRHWHTNCWRQELRRTRGRR